MQEETSALNPSVRFSFGGGGGIFWRVIDDDSQNGTGNWWEACGEGSCGLSAEAAGSLDAAVPVWDTWSTDSCCSDLWVSELESL